MDYVLVECISMNLVFWAVLTSDSEHAVMPFITAKENEKWLYMVFICLLLD